MARPARHLEPNRRPNVASLVGDLEVASGMWKIERVENPSPQEFRKRYFEARRPVILTGISNRWPAARLWTPEYLKARVGARPVWVHFSPDGVHQGDPIKGYYQNRRMAFDAYVDLVESGHSEDRVYYLAGQNLPDRFPELMADVELPPYIRRRRDLLRLNFFYGVAGNVMKLHYDNAPNFLAQISGRKQLWLFPPEQTRFLYPHSILSETPHVARVDIENPILAAEFRHFYNADPLECSLGPGDMLFIPTAWWHQVRSLETGISLNFFYMPPYRYWLTRPALRTVLSGSLDRLHVKDLIKRIGLTRLMQ